jgi:uncharacterized alkaline shock family protein YloU
VTAPPTSPVDADLLAQRVADAVTADPAVVRLDGGAFGAIATHLPGRRLVGVRIGRGNDPVEIGVVLRLQQPVPDAVRALRRRVVAACAAAGHPVGAVDVTVSDVEVPDVEVPDVAGVGPGAAAAP